MATPLLSGGAKAEAAGPRPTAFFSNNVRVNSGGTPYSWQVEPTMVVAESGEIHVGWKEANSDAGGGQRVAYSHSSDGGATWSANVLMATANSGTRASDPWLVRDGSGRVHFTRLEYDSAGSISGITTSNTTDGTSWGGANYLSDLPNFADKETVFADAGGVLYMAYNSDSINNDMFFRKSFDGGATWTSRVRVPDSIGGVIGAYVVVDIAGRIFVAWANYNTGNIMIDSSADGGATWGTDIRVNDVPGTINDPLPTNWNMSMPAIAVDKSDNLHVIWTDYRNPNSFGDIYVSRSGNHGATWDAAVKVSDYNGPAAQRMADITVDSNAVLHAVWYDHRNGGYDVYYSSSSDGGQTWSPNLRVSTATTDRMYQRPGDYITIRTNPVDNNVYIVWTDGRGADFDIYFAAMHDMSSAQLITTNPPNLEVTIDGMPYRAPQIRDWNPGETHEIGTLATQSLSYGIRFAFIDWSDGLPIVHQVITPNGSATYTARFLREYLLNVSSAYGTASLGGWYASGDVTVVCVIPTLVQISPDTRYRLIGWGGDVTGYGSCSDVIFMNSPKNATAIWKAQYLVNASSPYGTASGGGWFDDGNITTVNLDIGFVQISAGERATFLRWSGNASGTSLTSDPLLVDSPKAAAASWRLEYLLTIVSAHGDPQGGGWHADNSVAHIYVETIVGGGAGTRYVFSGWTGGITSSQASADAMMAGPTTVTATWTTEYYVEVLSDHGMVNGTGWYAAGSVANITAPPSVVDANDTWNFANWSGDFISTQNTSAVLVDGPKTIRASWVRAPEKSEPAVNVFLIPLVVVVVALLLVILLAYWRRRKEKAEQSPDEPPKKEVP